MPRPKSDGNKVLMDEFVSRVSRRSGLSSAAVRRAYAAMRDEVIDAVSDNETVLLWGFGRFTKRDLPGHAVNFGAGQIDGYSCLRFYPSRAVNRDLTERARAS